MVNVPNSKSSENTKLRENTTLIALDPYADPYGDRTGWTRQFRMDYDLRVFREKGQKSLQPQRKIPILAAHNPEVVGSSPASATRKTPDFERNPVFFLCFFYSFAMGNVNILKDQLSGFPYVFPYAFTALKNCSIRLALSCFIF